MGLADISECLLEDGARRLPRAVTDQCAPMTDGCRRDELLRQKRLPVMPKKLPLPHFSVGEVGRRDALRCLRASIVRAGEGAANATNLRTKALSALHLPYVACRVSK